MAGASWWGRKVRDGRATRSHIRVSEGERPGGAPDLCGRSRRRRALLAGLALAGAGAFAAGGPAGSAEGQRSGIAVVDSAVAARWLAQCGIPCARRSGASLGGSPIQSSKILVLPVESVRTPGAARVVNDFVADGGKLLAVYWGTLVAQGNPQTSPAYALTKLLGFRPVGWLGDCPDTLVLAGAGNGALPYAGLKLNLGNTQTVLADPLPGTRVIGKWDGDSSTNGHNVAAFQHGGVLYLSANLLRPGTTERADARELFFWALQRLAPEGQVYQAKERVTFASAEVASAAVQLQSTDPPEFRAQLEACRTTVGDARMLLPKWPLRAVQSADRARFQAERLQEKLREAHKRS